MVSNKQISSLVYGVCSWIGLRCFTCGVHGEPRAETFDVWRRLYSLCSINALAPLTYHGDRLAACVRSQWLLCSLACPSLCWSWNLISTFDSDACLISQAFGDYSTSQVWKSRGDWTVMTHLLLALLLPVFIDAYVLFVKCLLLCPNSA